MSELAERRPMGDPVNLKRAGECVVHASWRTCAPWMLDRVDQTICGLALGTDWAWVDAPATCEACERVLSGGSAPLEEAPRGEDGGPHEGPPAPMAAQGIAEQLRRGGHRAVAVVTVLPSGRVEHWVDAATWREAGALLGGLHVTATDLAMAIAALGEKSAPAPAAGGGRLP